MTSDKTPYGEVITLNFRENGSKQWHIFDAVDSTSVCLNMPNGAIGYKFVNPICVKKATVLNKYAEYTTEGDAPNSISLQAYDGSQWIDLKTIESPPKELVFDVPENTNYYTQYRIFVPSNNANTYVGFNNLQFYGRFQK